MAGYGTSCGACRFLRRKCSNDCIFAPYFCYDEGATHFSAIHKVFGASNVSKLLSHLPIHNRSEAAITISYEAQARIRDPIYGCVAHIFALQQQVADLQEEIDLLAIQTSQPTLNAVDNYATPQAININGFQFSLQQEHTNLHDSLNPISTLNVNCEWAFDSEVGHQRPAFHPETIDRWDHCLLSDIVNGPKSSEKIAVDVMDHVIWPNETCFDSSICPQF